MRRLPGITLLEMLVALALTGLVLVLMVQMLQASGRAAASAAGQAALAEQVALRREIRGAFARLLNAPDEGYALTGTAEAMVFHARQRVDAFPDTYAVEVAVDIQAEALVLTRKILDADQAILGLSQQSIALPGAARITYLAPCVFAEDWQESWDLTPQTPVAIRIEIEADFWPEFVVARPPMIGDEC